MMQWFEHPDLESTVLTMVVEAIGKSEVSWMVVKLIPPLLDHERPIVRGAAVYALEGHMLAAVQDRQRMAAAIDKIRDMEKNDPSPGVRQACTDVLGEL